MSVPAWVYKLWRFLNPPPAPELSGIVGINMEQPQIQGVAIVFTNGRAFFIDYPSPRTEICGELSYADFCAAEAQGKRVNTTLHVLIKERDDPDG